MKPLRVLTAVLTAALLCVLAAPALASAADAKDKYGESTPLNLPADTGSSHAEVASGGGSLTRTFIGLAVVVAIIYGLTWVLRQMKKNSSKDVRASGFGLSTEATVPLGPGRSVHLIRAGRELVLVGSAEHGVVPIRTYTEDEARELGLLSDDDEDDAGRGAGRSSNVMRNVVGDALDRLRQRTIR